jgi:hypothetical protein
VVFVDQNGPLSLGAHELLQKIMGSIMSQIGPNIIVVNFTPKWILGGAAWVGRFDYIVGTSYGAVQSVMIEGDLNYDSLIIQRIAAQPAQLSHPSNRRLSAEENAAIWRSSRSLLQIELDGPGLERIG